MPDRPAQALPASPFVRLRSLLDNETPAQPTLSLALGEPRHAPPDFVLHALSTDQQGYASYPPIQGLPEWRAAVAQWLTRRFGLSADLLGAPGQILPLNGTREGLFLAAQTAPAKADGLMAMPNPFYQVYAAAARAAGAEMVYLDATQEDGFLPNLDALSPDTLSRLRALYLCSPANPQGAIADLAYLEKAYDLAKQHNFLLLVDECYAEIYDAAAPPSMLQIMDQRGERDAPVIAFHSLSKRSNLPGLRSGFCAGGQSAMQALHDLRAVAGPQSPAPVQRAAALAWSDDAHVEKNRDLYKAKFDVAEKVFADWPGFTRPAAGFFLWLPVPIAGGGEAAALKLWRDCGIRVLPGAYLTQPSADGTNIGAGYIRIALVGDLAETEKSLPQIVACLAPDLTAEAARHVEVVT